MLMRDKNEIAVTFHQSHLATEKDRGLPERKQDNETDQSIYIAQSC